MVLPLSKGELEGVISLKGRTPPTHPLVRGGARQIILPLGHRVERARPD